MNSNELLKTFYKSLDTQNKTNILEKSNDILVYFDNFRSDLKTKGLLKKILKTRWTKKEQSPRDEAIIQSAKEYFSFLFESLQKNDGNDNSIINSLKTAFADLSFPLKRLDSTFTKNFILGSTRTQLTSIEFKLLKNLFYTNSLPATINRYELDHIIIPYLRTILESKIKKILGIDTLTDSKNQEIKTSKIIDILFKIGGVSLEKKSFDIEMLKLIMSWLNHHMHRNIRPESYIIHSVLNYLSPIFKPGKRELENSTLYSIDMSAYVEDKDSFQKEIEANLSIRHPGYKVIWTDKEIATPYF